MSRVLDVGKTSRYKVDEILRSIDWHSPTPPPGYKYGIGRGDHGFVTSVMASSRGGAGGKMSAEEVSGLEAMDAIFGAARMKRKRDDGDAGKNGAAANGGARLESASAVMDILGVLDALDNQPVKLNPTSAQANENQETTVGASTRAIAAQLKAEVGLAPVSSAAAAAAGPSEDHIRQMGSDSEPQTWISRARMLRQQGKERRARETLLQGGKITKSPIVFEEAIANETSPEERRKIAEDAVYNICPSAAGLWLAFANMQALHAKKQSVLQDAVERCPNDEELWLALIGSYPKEEHLTLLKEARKKVPTSTNVWVLLAHEVPQRSKGREVLAEAIKRMPNNVDLRTAAAEFEEKHFDALPDPKTSIANIAKGIVETGKLRPAEVVAMAENAITATRGHTFALELLRTTFAPQLSDTWVEDMQTYLYPFTSKNHEGEEKPKKKVAASLLSKNGYMTGLLLAAWRLVLDVQMSSSASEETVAKCPPANTALLNFIVNEIAKPAASIADACSSATSRVGDWQQLAEETVKAYPRDGVICVIMARLLFINGYQSVTETIFNTALVAAGNNELLDAEAVVVGAAKLAALGADWQRAENILETHIAKCAAAPLTSGIEHDSRISPRVFLKLAILHREQQNIAKELSALNRGIDKYPTNPKLWCMKLLHTSKHQSIAVRAVRQEALSATHCRTIPQVWAYAATLESEMHGNPAGARALLTEAATAARSANNNAVVDLTPVWEARVRLEEVHSGSNAAYATVCEAVKALSAAAANSGAANSDTGFVVSPLLANKRIDLAPPHERPRAAEYVVKNVLGKSKHGLVDLAIAKLHWAVALKNKSKKSLVEAFKMAKRAIKHSPRCGDCYALMIRFLTEVHSGVGPYQEIFTPSGQPEKEDFPLTIEEVVAQAVGLVATSVTLNEGSVWLKVAKEDITKVSIRGLETHVVEGLLRAASRDPTMVVG